jgi:hypothetical protein
MKSNLSKSVRSKEKMTNDEGAESETSEEIRLTPEYLRRPTILLLDDPEFVD